MKYKVLILILCLVITSCANVRPMAINKNTQTLDTKEKSIVLLSFTLSRPEPSRFTPHPLWVRFELNNAEGKKEVIPFKVDNESGNTDSELTNTFYFRMALSPGEYNLHTVIGNANAFPLNGFFALPLLTKIRVSEDSIEYLGRIDALMRPRKEGEFRAGSLLPLIDQAVTGVSGSTFDVVIKDNFDEDLKQFRTRFPVLINKEVKLNLLNDWKREAAQTWWHGDSAEANQ